MNERVKNITVCLVLVKVGEASVPWLCVSVRGDFCYGVGSNTPDHTSDHRRAG